MCRSMSQCATTLILEKKEVYIRLLYRSISKLTYLRPAMHIIRCELNFDKRDEVFRHCKFIKTCLKHRVCVGAIFQVGMTITVFVDKS